MTRNIPETAAAFMEMSDERLRLIALRDPDAIRDLAAAYASKTAEIDALTEKATEARRLMTEAAREAGALAALLTEAKAMLERATPVLRSYYRNLALSFCQGDGPDFDLETIENRSDYADTVSAKAAMEAARDLLAKLETTPS